VPVDVAYRQLILMSTSDPVIYRFSAVTGTMEDQREDLRKAIVAEFHDDALEYGVDLNRSVDISASTPAKACGRRATVSSSSMG